MRAAIHVFDFDERQFGNLQELDLQPLEWILRFHLLSYSQTS